MPESVRSPYANVWSDNVLALSLAVASSTNHAPLPLNATILGTSSTSGNHLVVLDALQGTAQYRDAYGWRENLKALDRDWFGPLWGMFRQGQVDQVTLTTLDDKGTTNFVVRRRDLGKFWRRPKPILRHAPK